MTHRLLAASWAGDEQAVLEKQKNSELNYV
jgi:hypothetical protein